MIVGTFTTTAFDSRRDFERGLPSDVMVSRNHFTAAGLDWMWQMLAGALRGTDGMLTDQLASARIAVGNGDAPFEYRQERLQGELTAQAALDEGFPVFARSAPNSAGEVVSSITFRATFGEQDAAFDWQERGVVTAQGVLLDRAVQDQGRKVLGAIWQCQATLELGSGV